MIKSPLRYPGGKSKAIKFIAPLIPNFKEYREPFLGGGSVFIYLKQLYPDHEVAQSDRTYWVNDIYENLFYFWESCQENLEGLIEQIIAWKQEFQEGKLLYKYLIENIENFNELEKASTFLSLIELPFQAQQKAEAILKKPLKKDLLILVLKELKIYHQY